MANSLPVYLVSFFSGHVFLTITLLLFLNTCLVGDFTGKVFTGQ